MDKFEEYKLLIDRTEKLSERRQTASQIYLTVNTVIFGAFAFFLKDSGLHNQPLLWGIIPLTVVGIIICVIWLNIMIRLEKVLGWQYKYLREMETRMPDSEQLFTKESAALYTQDKKPKKFSFSLLEAWLPSILIAVYTLCLIGIYIAIRAGKF
jgi:hypothetical protein